MIKNEFKNIKENLNISFIFKEEGYELLENGKGQYKCRCINPNHIDNNPSLVINDNKRIFKCFSCGIYGDIFNLLSYKYPLTRPRQQLEYIKTKYINKNLPSKEGKIDFDNFIISPLGGNNIQDDKDFIEIMNEISEYFTKQIPRNIYKEYLLNKKCVFKKFKNLEVCINGYSLRKKIIKKFKIGFSPNNKELYNILIKKYDKNLIEKIGIFSKNGLPIFKNRIIIPYIKDGNVVYFTGRETYLTPKNRYLDGKYINQKINNKYLYNEDNLNFSPYLLITEGEFDSLSLENIGIKSIALGGIEKIDLILEKINLLNDKYLVNICFDNEINGTGNKKAIDLNNILLKNKVNSHIITLPLGNGEDKIDVNKFLCNYGKSYFSRFITYG